MSMQRRIRSPMLDQKERESSLAKPAPSRMPNTWSVCSSLSFTSGSLDFGYCRRWIPVEQSTVSFLCSFWNNNIGHQKNDPRRLRRGD